MRMAKFKTQHELKRILSMILAMCFVIVTVITDTSMTAQAADNTWSFSYTGGIQSFTAPETGTYTIDAYGASGGGCSDKGGYWIGTKGGYGGHAAGSVTLVKGQTIYIAVGGQGSMSSSSASAAGGCAGTVYQFAYAKLPTTYQGSGVLNGINTYMDDTDHTWECNSIDFDKNWCAMYGGSFSGGSGLWTNQYGRGAGGGYKNGSYGGAGSNACASGSPGQNYVLGFDAEYSAHIATQAYVKMTCHSKTFTIANPVRSGYSFAG